MNKLKSPIRLLLTAIISITTAPLLPAAMFYVNVASASPSSPFTNWITAARTIQDAIDAANSGDEIVVTNGVYQTGGGVVYGSMTNRVAVTKALIVRSVNGPEMTVIAGSQVQGTTNGDSAVRCVYLTNGTTLVGFTLTNGATRTSGDFFGERSGGGVFCASVGAVVSNCVLSGNSATYAGGGVYQGTLNDCLFSGNSSAFAGGGASGSTLNNCTLTGNLAGWYGGGADFCTLNDCTLTRNTAGISGGGAEEGTLNNCALSGNSASEGGASYFGTLNNCTLTGNSANYGGGAYFGTLNNCIVYYNVARLGGANYSSASFNYSCTTPLPPDGAGNISAEPQLASASHLSAASPCRGSGSAAYASGEDIDGEMWATPPSMGCDEYRPESITGPLSVEIQAAVTEITVGFNAQFSALIAGHVGASRWDFTDGTVVSNRPDVELSWLVPGYYPIVLTAYNESRPEGVSATLTVRVLEGVHYVAADGSHPVAPYASWATAARKIQDAIDVAETGHEILVTNGIYKSGSDQGNVVVLSKPVTLRSVNGPDVTFIDGSRGVRCVYMSDAAMLVGFTLTNGVAGDGYGGGVSCASSAAEISNCVLSGNSAAYLGGGSSGGTLNNCTISGNSANYGGGAVAARLNNCTLTENSASIYGGGAERSTLNNCTLKDNSAAFAGGGADESLLTNCTITGNSAQVGGGVAAGTTSNCTLAANSADRGGAAYNCTLDRCVLTGNSADAGGGAERCALMHCTLTGNTAGISGGATFYSTLDYCTLSNNSAINGAGGGAVGRILNNCAIISNSAYEGGGVSAAALNNCTIIGNVANVGGGAYGDTSYKCTLNNCTLSLNSADASGGGAQGCCLNNCIVYANTSNGSGPNYDSSTLDYCSTTPLPPDGMGNLTNEPSFIDPFSGNFRLTQNSPCINAGNNLLAPNGPDLDGHPRIAGGTVDVGAYEFQYPQSLISYAWLQQYGLPIDRTTDSDDPDGDRSNNWQEWRAGTDPTNALSTLRLLTPTPIGSDLILSWESAPGKDYFLEWTTNFGAPPVFEPLATHLPASATNTTTFTHTNATSLGPLFYRVGVE